MTTDNTVEVRVPAELQNIGAILMTAVERAADRIAREAWLEGRHEYYVEDAIASEQGVDALGQYTERMSEELVVAGVVGRKPQNKFIEYGRQPGPMPLEDPAAGEEDEGQPYPQILVDWMKDKGITPRSGDTSDLGYRDAARNIGWALLKFGYDAREPVTHGIEHMVEAGTVERIINDSVTRSLRARGLLGK